MITWLALHWIDLLVHLSLDVTGGLTLRCVMGLCQHKRHQYMAWALFSILFSISTVMLVG